jgi:microcystin-dependent protein
MGDWFLGEIRVFPYGFAPAGWLDCDGRTLQIMQYQALYSLLRTNFGGDGQKTFALPDLRGRVAVPPTTKVGEMTGVESYTLLAAEVSPHTHVPQGSNAPGTASAIANNVWAAGGTGQNLYSVPQGSPATVAMNAKCVQAVGGGQAHANVQPFQVLRYCIAVQGIYPPQQ